MRGVRKLITMSDLGALLLDKAAGKGRQRAGGDYVSEIVRQRYHAWQEALQLFLARGITHAELKAGIEALAGLAPTLQDRAGAIQRRLPHSLGSRFDHVLCLAFCDLAEEYIAGNRLLIDTLTQPTPSNGVANDTEDLF